jgi:hypothetical protein
VGYDDVHYLIETKGREDVDFSTQGPGGPYLMRECNVDNGIEMTSSAIPSFSK